MEKFPAWISELAKQTEIPDAATNAQVIELPLAAYRNLRSLLEGMTVYIAAELKRCGK